jgi:hypothetical protein
MASDGLNVSTSDVREYNANRHCKVCKRNHLVRLTLEPHSIVIACNHSGLVWRLPYVALGD